jgi:hypothetical protein
MDGAPGGHSGTPGKNRRKRSDRADAQKRKARRFAQAASPSSAFREEIIVQRALALAMGLLIMAFAAVHLALTASGQTGPGWVTLLDGKSMADWDQVGQSNWRSEDGAIVADKKAADEAGFLVSKSKYKDFMLHVEFWASDDANSGIYMRCQDAKKLTDRSCYEANIFDQRKDPTYGTGGIVHFAEVKPMPKAGGKWNTFEITAKGRQITVVMNGQKTAELHNGLFVEGPIGLQHGAGTIKFRKVAIKPL